MPKCTLVAMPKSPLVHELLDELEQVHGRARFVNRFEPMEELISCIMSQSASDAASFPAFTRLIERFPTWQALVEAPADSIVETIACAGLANQKAKNIQATLREIRFRNGEFSLENLREMETLEATIWLESLPGVGPKTAAIVLAFSFGRPVIPVDTHVFRVAHRIGWIEPGIGERKAHTALAGLVEPVDALRFHTLLIQHGRKVCKSQNPRCNECLISEKCRYHRSTKPREPNRNTHGSRTNK